MEVDRLQAMPTASTPDVVLWLSYITGYFQPRSFTGLKPFPAVQMILIKQQKLYLFTILSFVITGYVVNDISYFLF